MKRVGLLFLAVSMLMGCDGNDQALNKTMEVRQRALTSEQVSFNAIITADYQDEIYTFSMSCEANEQGVLSFCVEAPESIQGITGNISSEGGKLTFDEEVLAFPTIADGQISPVSAPWVFVKTLKSGYIHAATELDEGFLAQIHDTYEENALKTDITFSDDAIPSFVEIYWKERRILCVEIEDFCYM